MADSVQVRWFCLLSWRQPLPWAQEIGSLAELSGFAGVVAVDRGGETEFAKAYGLADRERLGQAAAGRVTCLTTPKTSAPGVRVEEVGVEIPSGSPGLRPVLQVSARS
jgi:hypothetical protein